MDTFLRIRLEYSQQPDWMKPPVQGAVLTRLRDDSNNPAWGYKPRYNPKLNCPPMVNPFYVDCSLSHGTLRTDMSRHGWKEYIQKLNGDKWKQSVADNLAMFNTAGWPKMESLGFGCNLFWAIDGPKSGWAQVLTLDYRSGPPSNMPTWEENPVAVQKLTIICRSGNIFQHKNKFCYPVVSASPVFIPWDRLEPYSDHMKTPAPPP